MTNTLIYRNSKIESYKGERPSRRNYGETPPPFAKDSGDNSDVEKWESSKKEYSFANIEESKLLNHLHETLKIAYDKLVIDCKISGINVTGLVEIKNPNKIGNKNFLDEYYAYFLSPDKAENSQETFTKDDLKMAHYIGASFGYNKKCCTVKERGSDFEDWFTNNFKRK